MALRLWPVVLILSLVVSAQAFQADHRGVRDFPEELGRNFIALFERSNLIPLGVAGAAAGGALAEDREVKDYFGGARRFREFGDAGEILGGPLVVPGVVGAAFLAGRWSAEGRFRSMSYTLAQTTTLNAGLALAAKAAVRRERPNGENDHSFYSAHSANAFSVAAVVENYYGTRAAIAAYSAAGLISVSRLERRKHYLSDVITGALAGYIVGQTACRRDKLSRRLAAISVAPGAHGGVVLSLALGSR